MYSDSEVQATTGPVLGSPDRGAAGADPDTLRVLRSGAEAPLAIGVQRPAKDGNKPHVSGLPPLSSREVLMCLVLDTTEGSEPEQNQML